MLSWLTFKTKHIYILKITIETCCHSTFINIIGGSCHKYYFCCDKSFVMLVTNACLLWQNMSLLRQKYAGLVVTNICYNKHNFVATKVWSWQAYFCCDKTFVATKMILVAAPASDILSLFIFLHKSECQCHQVWHFTYSIIMLMIMSIIQWAEKKRFELDWMWNLFLVFFLNMTQFHVFKNHHIKCNRGYCFAKFERSHFKLDSFRQANSQC